MVEEAKYTPPRTPRSTAIAPTPRRVAYRREPMSPIPNFTDAACQLSVLAPEAWFPASDQAVLRLRAAGLCPRGDFCTPPLLA